MGAGLRPKAKGLDKPPDPTVRAPVLDPTDERGVEPGHGRDGGTPAYERAGQQGKTNFDLNYRATPRLYAREFQRGCSWEFQRGRS